MILPLHTPLSDAQQTGAGVPQPAALAMAGQVHHDELDALMHVNNVVYLVWFERLRIAFMERYGIGTIGDPASPRIVIRSGEIRYHAELLRGEIYITTCRCTAFRTTSMTLQQEVWSGGALRAGFTCVMVLLEQDGTTRLAIPDSIKAQLITQGASPPD
jgi:acyl-CoA thioester hydrolase